VPVLASRSSSEVTPRQWGAVTYAATAIMSLFLTPEMEARTFFILIFGYYPLLRELLHQIRFRPARFLLKLVFFNVTAVVAFFIVVNLVLDLEKMLVGMEEFGEYAVYALWGMGNIAFIIYDFALSYVYYAFNHWVKPVIIKKTGG